MPPRKLPDLSPRQVERLLDALLSNADALLNSALVVLGIGQVALARSLAILGLEESGKAIAIHERRVEIVRRPEGEPFRCTALDELWVSHTKKLDKVYAFLVDEKYWWGLSPSDPAHNARELGTIRAWRRNDDRKQRGFYVELSNTGDPMAPADIGDEEHLRAVIDRVHQIGWQLRLGEHIEGKKQDERERGVPAEESDPAMAGFIQALPLEMRSEFERTLREGIPGEPLTNAAYRVNRPGERQNPFRNLGQPGYEAQTREIAQMWQHLDDFTKSLPRPDDPDEEGAE